MYLNNRHTSNDCCDIIRCDNNDDVHEYICLLLFTSHLHKILRSDSVLAVALRDACIAKMRNCTSNNRWVEKLFSILLKRNERNSLWKKLIFWQYLLRKNIDKSAIHAFQSLFLLSSSFFVKNRFWHDKKNIKRFSRPPFTRLKIVADRKLHRNHLSICFHCFLYIYVFKR